MMLLSKRLTAGRFSLTVAVARTPLANGGTRYSQRVEFQASGDEEVA